MDLKGMGSSWMPTAFGFVGSVLLYFSQLGANFPTTKQEWLTTGAAAALAGLGLSAKQYNVSNSGVPVQARPVDSSTLPPGAPPPVVKP